MIAAVVLAAGPHRGTAAEMRVDAAPLIDAWLLHQTNLTAWTAGVVQTRLLQSLTQPLVSTGRVWFAAPDRFRWELGVPAQTIAVRRADDLLVLYPRLQRAERYRLEGNKAGAWSDALTLIESGTPRSRADLDSKLRLIDAEVTNGTFTLLLEPRSRAARRMIPRIRLMVETHGFNLLLSELQFADGSRLRNEFIDPVINPPLAPDLFDPPIAPDMTVTEPLAAP